MGNHLETKIERFDVFFLIKSQDFPGTRQIITYRVFIFTHYVLQKYYNCFYLFYF